MGADVGFNYIAILIITTFPQHFQNISKYASCGITIFLHILVERGEFHSTQLSGSAAKGDPPGV